MTSWSAPATLTLRKGRRALGTGRGALRRQHTGGRHDEDRRRQADSRVIPTHTPHLADRAVFPAGFAVSEAAGA